MPSLVVRVFVKAESDNLVFLLLENVSQVLPKLLYLLQRVRKPIGEQFVFFSQFGIPAHL